MIQTLQRTRAWLPSLVGQIRSRSLRSHRPTSAACCRCLDLVFSGESRKRYVFQSAHLHSSVTGPQPLPISKPLINLQAGGTNPALRTLYYRLTRLLSLNITPLFVFDGRSRPAFKRNHKTHAHITPALTKSTKALLKLFGFPYHDAPGEAEAECAILQQQGVVDAVLSEDVDTLMFGCGTTFRNWSAQGGGGGKVTPTHVTVYERGAVEAESGLTSEGMVLVALMSGGDYLPEGVPKCGIRIAAECARAGFGADLCALGEDEQGLKEWRERLQWELNTNESGWFKRKHKAIKIPADFPDRTVLGYYTNPVVSNLEAVEKLGRNIKWDGQVDLLRLRETVRHAFEWRGKKGAAKFVRTLAPAFLARKLADGNALENIVKGLHGTREHLSTDGLKEIRISFVPGEVIIVDMIIEAEDEVEEGSEREGDEEGSEQGTRKVKDYDIFAVERIWVQDLYARRSLLEMITAWEQPSVAKGKAKKTAPKTNPKKKEKAAEMSILAYLNISKPSSQNIVSTAEKLREVERESEMGIWKDMRPVVASRVLLDCVAASGEFLNTNGPPAVAPKFIAEDIPPPKKKSSESKPKLAKGPARCPRDGDVQGYTGESDPWSRAKRPVKTLGIYGGQLPEPFDETSYPFIDDPYDLPDSLAPSPLPSPPPTRSRSPPLENSRYQAILISSSPEPVPAAHITLYIPPPSSPWRRCKSSPNPESPRPSTPTRDHTPEGPRTPTAAFQRLQVVDLLGDGTPDEGDGRLNRILEFSPTPLSPNVTIRKKREGKKLQGPQSALRSNSELRCTASIPFPLCISPLRRTVSATVEGRGEMRNGKTAKRVVLRESLEGRWEFIEDTWSVREGSKVWEDLDVLDLTGDD